ncbi:MAG: hypothetical protein JXA73_15400 [Acidobacteria bacterium]|nr:hypothetical protein [Acidobacteriota bacterium]
MTKYGEKPGLIEVASIDRLSAIDQNCEQCRTDTQLIPEYKLTLKTDVTGDSAEKNPAESNREQRLSWINLLDGPYGLHPADKLDLKRGKQIITL